MGVDRLLVGLDPETVMAGEPGRRCRGTPATQGIQDPIRLIARLELRGGQADQELGELFVRLARLFRDRDQIIVKTRGRIEIQRDQPIAFASRHEQP